MNIRRLQSTIGWGDHPCSSSLEESLELCEEIIGNTRSAVEVLDDLLNYDKIEVGALVLDPSFVALDYILEMVVKPFSGPAKAKDVSIVTNTAGYASKALFKSDAFGGKFASLRVLGDKVRLQQVIRNLISNALKFTPQGGTITVTLEWVEGGLPSAVFSPEIQRWATAAYPPTQLMSHSGKGYATAGRAALAAEEERSDSFLRSGDLGASVRIVVLRSYSRALSKRTVSCRHGSLRLSVRDTGAGLSALQLQNICSEGVQFNVNALQAGQGSGLGLFIAKGERT
jgi:signal transduction histidine kinase